MELLGIWHTLMATYMCYYAKNICGYAMRMFGLEIEWRYGGRKKGHGFSNPRTARSRTGKFMPLLTWSGLYGFIPKPRLELASAVGKSSGIGWVTLPEAAHSVPLVKDTIKPTLSNE